MFLCVRGGGGGVDCVRQQKLGSDQEILINVLRYFPFFFSLR